MNKVRFEGAGRSGVVYVNEKCVGKVQVIKGEAHFRSFTGAITVVPNGFSGLYRALTSGSLAA